MRITIGVLSSLHWQWEGLSGFGLLHAIVEVETGSAEQHDGQLFFGDANITVIYYSIR